MPKVFKELINGVNVEYQKIKGVPHLIFNNIDDFKAYFVAEGISVPKVINWRDGYKDDWVYSDDNRIIQIVFDSEITRRGRNGETLGTTRWVRTVVGSFAAAGNQKMDTDFNNHPSRYSFSRNILTVSRYKKEGQKASVRELEFCAEVIKTKNISLSSMAILYTRYIKVSKNIAFKRCLTLLRKEPILMDVRKDIESAAEKLGITVESILQNIKDLANGSRRDDVRLSASEKLGKYIGMDDGGLGSPAVQGFGELEGLTEIYERHEQIGESGSLIEEKIIKSKEIPAPARITREQLNQIRDTV